MSHREQGIALSGLGKVRALLLDMDGTLVDSEAAVARAWSTWAAETGFDVPRGWVGTPGVTASDAIAAMHDQMEAEEIAAHGQRMLDLQYDDVGDVRAADGAHRLIALAVRLEMPWAVVTSADRRLATARLRAAGIEAPVLVTEDDVSVAKPDPSGYLIGAERLGVAPSACLVVEDATAGVAAGRAAGCWTAGLRGLEADLTIADLGELADLLEGDLSVV